MRPDAPMFAPPTTRNTTPSTNGYLAVVPYNATSGHGVDDTHTSPRQLIMHESLSHLIKEVQGLKTCCDGLEDTNTKLQDGMVALERTCSATAVQPPAGRGLNLGGYSSSETSSTTDRQLATKVEMDSLNVYVNGHVKTVEKILVEFKEHLVKVEKDVDKMQFAATGVKGRVGAVEAKLKEVIADLEDINRTNSGQRNDVLLQGPKMSFDSDEMASCLSDRIERIHGKLNFTSIDVEALRNEVKAQGMAVNELQTMATADDNGSKKKYTPATTGDAYGQTSTLQIEVERLRTTMQAMKKKADMEEKIDEAASRESLHIMFHQLNDIMAEKCLCAGGFEGTFDELFPLRDRVIRRLAVYDHYEKAFQEAKKADVVY